MRKDPLHHSDGSAPAAARKAGALFLDLLACYGPVLAAHGRPMTWNGCFRSRAAFDMAVHRLQKTGALVVARRGNGERVFRVGANHDVPLALRPEPFWNGGWDGLWRVLVYDVPESERSLRDRVRRFLSRRRMGRLQASVWVSPWDVRPDYADLQTALGAHAVSFLFEARTVLGRKNSELVVGAWDFARIVTAQRSYLNASGKALAELESGALSPARAAAIARQDLLLYLSAMAGDPLLSRTLWPSAYLGGEALALHRRVEQSVRTRLTPSGRTPGYGA